MKILTDSPWIAVAQPENPKQIRRAALISSVAVREAMLREMQIQQKYDKRLVKWQQAFDRENETCLTDSKYRNNIVIRVWGGPPIASPDAGMIIFSGGTKLGAKNNAMSDLRCGGGSFPWQYTPSAMDAMHADDASTHGGGASPDARREAMDFIFPRLIEGKPILVQTDGTMRLNWGEKAGVFTFHFSDLVYNKHPDF